jgi:hypothetical protein
LITSNHPIYWLINDLRYAFRQAIVCLSAVIIQHANIAHPATSEPAPIAKNLNITYFDFYTRISYDYANVSVISPHKRANAGIAAPIKRAEKVPIIKRAISSLVANLKSSKKVIWEFFFSLVERLVYKFS